VTGLGGWVQTATTVTLTTNSASVGIGTGSPTQKLDVVGNVKFSGALMPNNTAGTAGQYLMSQGTGSAPVWTTSASGWGLTGNAGTSSGTNFIGTTDAQNLILKSNNVNAIQIFTTGNVGINSGQVGGRLNVSANTTTPGAFGIYSEINFNSSTNPGGLVAGGYFTNNSSGTGGTQLNTAITGYMNLTGNNTSSYNTGGWMHGISTSGSHGNMTGVIGSLENYGASITNAYGGYFTHMANTGTITNGYGIYVGTIFGNNKWSLYASDNSAPSYFAGNVGIGNSSPASLLNVGSIPSDLQTPTMRVYTNGGTGWQGNAAFGGTVASVMLGQIYDMAVMGGHNANLAAWSDLAINPIGGNVGIHTGTAAPTAALHVSLSLRYQDGNEGAGKVLTSDASGNASWQAFGSGGAWSLTGNAGTTPGTNFIGTTDSQDLIFRTNNSDRIQIDPNGRIGINTTPTNLDNLYVLRPAMSVGDYGPNMSNIMGYRGGTGTAANGGTGWTYNTIDAAIKGESFWGNNYTAGMAGYNYNDFANSAGVLGSQYNANYWGALAFNDGVNQWGIFSPYNAYVGGYLGIGNQSPTANLDITGTMRLVDGNEGVGKVLTSDAAGNASWQSASASSGWGLSGNSGTSPTTNFVGTIDNVALRFRVNNQPAGILDPAGSTFFGVFSGYNNTSGSNSGYGYNSLFSNTSGSDNTAIGSNVMVFNTNGSSNTAIGGLALYSNVGGNYNTASGYYSMHDNSSGSFNTAYGMYALRTNSTSNNNVAVGFSAGDQSTGSGNTFIGTAAGYGNTGSANVFLGGFSGYQSGSGSSNVFIGNAAGYYETGSNKLYIANTSTSVSPLMYGDFSAGKLSINTTTGLGCLTVDNQSVTSRSGILLTNGRDAVGAGMPVEIDAVTNGQTYGVNTYGRILRLQNTTQVKFYDLGIGSAGNFFIANNNNYSPAAVNITTLSNVGIGIANPLSTMDINGSFATTLVKSSGTGVLTLDGFGGVYYVVTAVSSIALPTANTCTNRRYIIVNRSGTAKTISSYTDLTGVASTSLPNNTSVEVISDGTNWLQIK
jgi:hypothetical protein